MTPVRIPAKAILQKRLSAITGVSMDALIDDLGLDIGKIEALTQALSAYKDDVFSNGIANLYEWSSSWPILKGHDNDHPIVSWKFQDRFRPRSFEMQFDLRTGEFSVTGNEKLGTGRLIEIEISDTIMSGLRSRLKPAALERLANLTDHWNQHHSSIMPQI
jgi:hypothetical protein